MRAVVQRVDKADVTVDGQVTGSVQKGLLVLLGVAEGDTEKDLQYMVDKVVGLRIFEDEDDKKPELANAYYEKFVEMCRAQGLHVETGVFRAHMLVGLVNNGPVTILLDSTKLF